MEIMVNEGGGFKDEEDEEGKEASNDCQENDSKVWGLKDPFGECFQSEIGAS